jgi:predicted ABC-type ATPase
MADINRLHLYIIAGCNGAGKTTASFTVLPEMLNCREFVNADEIAAGLSPFNPEGVAIQAGRLMIDRIIYLLKEGETFAFETTLATRSYVKLIRQAQKRGYFVTLLFFLLSTPEQAVARVAKRVAMGGHNIPTEVILRRYEAGLANLFQLFTRSWIERLSLSNIPAARFCRVLQSRTMTLSAARTPSDGVSSE